MEAPHIEIVCPHCRTALKADEDVCGHCGGSPTAEIGPAADLPICPNRVGFRDLLNNPWVILGLSFGVMGVLVLPVLWFSQAFSRPVKILLAIVVTVYTAVLIWLVWLILAWSWSRIEPVI